MNRIFVFLPAFNEEENIDSLVYAWLDEQRNLEAMGYSLTIHPIDDCSTDSTKQRMNALAESHPQVVPLFHEVNKNLGGGVDTALFTFCGQGKNGDLALLMDADNSQKPLHVTAMIEKHIATKADCIICSRYQKGAKVIGVPLIRELLSIGARWYYTWMLRVKNVRDYTCGYRLYTYDIIRKAYKAYGRQLVEQRGFTCMMEVLYKLACIGCEFAEVPFTLRYDNKLGESKMKVSNTVLNSFTAAYDLKKHIGK